MRIKKTSLKNGEMQKPTKGLSVFYKKSAHSFAHLPRAGWACMTKQGVDREFLAPPPFTPILETNSGLFAPLAVLIEGVTN